VRRVRALAWTVAAATAALSAWLSVVAAHAFKGHDGQVSTTAARSGARAVDVPRAQHVPAIDGAPAPLEPPAAAPTAVPPQPVPDVQPETSGGS